MDTSIKKVKQKHLGRGLQSLLSPIINAEIGQTSEFPQPLAPSRFPPDKELQESLRNLNGDDILPNPYQPRRTWDDDDLAELAESIKANGLVQPIIVRPSGAKYQLIAGERRLRAAKLAMLKSVPALVRQASDTQMLELALIENIHRRDLNPIERAEAYLSYLNKFSLTQAQAAERLGENRSVIANYLRLLELPADIKQMLIDGRLSMGHARAILGLPTDQLRRKLANRALARRLSVRDVERFVQNYVSENGPVRAGSEAKPPHIVDLENQLSGELATKVRIETRRKGQRGRVIIEFYSLDDFDRIMAKIGLKPVQEA